MQAQAECIRMAARCVRHCGCLRPTSQCWYDVLACSQTFAHRSAAALLPANQLDNQPPTSPPSATGHKQWVGVNDWQGLPAVQVALGVRSGELTDWVLDRMTR